MIVSEPIETFAPEIKKKRDPTGGYFTAVRLDDFSAASVAATAVYSRKDFYKISLISGNATYYYQGEKYNVKPGEWLLVFTNREVPYRWEVHEGVCSGYACMFTEDFLPLHTHIRPADWALFNGTAQTVFMLTNGQQQNFQNLFERMLTEQASGYEYKYDVLFLYVLECIHSALKFYPKTEGSIKSAAKRLTDTFKTLLAAQFPLTYPHQVLQLRVPQQFADVLSVHTNSLNRALKEVTGKTTSQSINERVMQEANALLTHSNWTISQIAGSLGFEEPTHFARAFRAYTGYTPSSFRSLFD